MLFPKLKTSLMGEITPTNAVTALLNYTLLNEL